MANRRIAMYQYRQIILQLQLGASDREIARHGLASRLKIKEVREYARHQQWLVKGAVLPSDEELAVHFQVKRPAQMISLAQIHEDDILSWVDQGITMTTIHKTLQRKYGFKGSYMSVQRFVKKVKAKHPIACAVLSFEPGVAAQIDFGKGPTITDVNTQKTHSTWFFVMTLCWSRHQYAEIVYDQTVETWLGCHRRAFCHLTP